MNESSTALVKPKASSAPEIRNLQRLRVRDLLEHAASVAAVPATR